jgi:hypothetical protein
MAMRDKIAGVINECLLHDDDQVSDYIYFQSYTGKELADAIIAELPDMIAPLVWEGGIAQNSMGGRYVIGWYDAGDLCTELMFYGYGNPTTRQYISGDVFVSDLKAAANTHHRNSIMAAFKGEKT